MSTPELDFLSIDVETATPDYHSICQVGIVGFLKNEPVFEQVHIIDPQVEFYPQNIKIHGIHSHHVIGKPTYRQFYNTLSNIITNHHIVSHSTFDRSAIDQACSKYTLPQISCHWIDSATAARRTWEQYSMRGYGLKNIAKDFGIQLNHHNALDDARAAGMIFCRILQETKTTAKDWVNLTSFQSPTTASRSNPQWTDLPPKLKTIKPSEGPLSNEIIVFTGELTISREEAAARASRLGAGVGTAVNKKTTIVVVGEQDLTLTKGKKSSKHIKAEEMMANGFSIRIIGEKQFLAMINS